jgi:putative salt-induced outer membrane protein YdiY
MFRTTLLYFSALLLLLPAIAGAQDRLVMVNGDIISGNITLITDENVEIEPSYSDAFAVDLASVATIEIDETFEVELSDDTELLGQLTLDDAGQQVLLTPEGASIPITLAQLAEAKEPEPYFDWSLKADFNGAYNSGNTDSENTLLFADGSVKWGDHRHRADFTLRNESVNDSTTQDQTLFNYGYNWFFNKPWFIGGAFTYERDPVRDLDYRYTASALVGRDIFNDATKYLGISVGPGYQEEKLGEDSRGGGVGIWTLRYEHALLTWVDFFHTQNFTWQFYGNENSIYKTNTGLSFDLISDLYFNLSLRFDYETEPAEGRSKDDSTFAFGVGYTF